MGVAAALIFGFVGRGNQTIGPSASSSGSATGSPEGSPSESATASSPTPTATASVPAEIREASAVATVPDCQVISGWSYTISGDDLYMICYDGESHPYIARIDFTSNKVKSTYGTELLMTYAYTVAVADGSLWYDVTLGSACLPDIGSCDGFHRLFRFDVATRKRTLDMPNVRLEASALGYLWVRDTSASDTTPLGQLRKLDPKTGKEAGRIPFTMDRLQFACGSMWGLSVSDRGTVEQKTTVARIDPADGQILASFTDPGALDRLQSVGSECWARAYPAVDGNAAMFADHFVRIGQSGVEGRSPGFVPSDQGDTSWTHVEILNGTFWLVSDAIGDPSATLQRLDPSTWEPSGPRWHCVSGGGYAETFTVIDGSVWTPDNDFGLARLDMPLDS